jgi:HEAT repeats
MKHAQISAAVFLLFFILQLSGCSTTGFSGKFSRNKSDGISPDQLAVLAGIFEKQGKTDQAVHIYSHVLKYFPKHEIANERLHALQNNGAPLKYSDMIIAKDSSDNLESANQLWSKPIPSVNNSAKIEARNINPNILTTQITSNKPVTRILTSPITSNKQVTKIIIPALKGPQRGSHVNTIMKIPNPKNIISNSKNDTKTDNNDIGFFLKTKNFTKKKQATQSTKDLEINGESYSTFIDKEISVVGDKNNVTSFTKKESGNASLNEYNTPVEGNINTKIKKASYNQNLEHVKPGRTSQDEDFVLVLDLKTNDKKSWENEKLINSVNNLVKDQKEDPFKKANSLLTDGNPANRINGIMLFTKDSSRTTHKTELLEKQLSVETNLLVRVHIASAILKLTPESETALPVLYDGLASTDRQIKLKSISAIGDSQCVNTKESVQLLLKALEDEDSHIRTTSAMFLSNVNIEYNLVTQGLTKALKDENVDVRIAADAALACIESSH